MKWPALDAIGILTSSLQPKKMAKVAMTAIAFYYAYSTGCHLYSAWQEALWDEADQAAWWGE